MTQPDVAMRKIQILQAMRALAAIAVLLFHAAGAAHKHGGPMPFFNIATFGTAGVDMFFVLSGFIILHATVGRGRSCRDYAVARFTRIYLPYWPVGLIMAFIVLGAMPHYGGARSWAASTLLLPVAQPALNVAWTLQHEVIFYAFVAIGYYSSYWRSGLALWIAAIVFFWLSGFTAPVGFQLIDTEFLMGVAAWASWKNGHRQIMLGASAVLCLLALGVGLFGLELGIERAGPIAFASVFAATLPWLVIGEQTGRIQTPKFLNFLGDASYSIYLVHALPLLLLIPIMAGSSWHVIFLVIGFAGLAAGIAYHLLVERPLLAWRRKS